MAMLNNQRVDCASWRSSRHCQRQIPKSPTCSDTMIEQTGVIRSRAKGLGAKHSDTGACCFAGLPRLERRYLNRRLRSLVRGKLLKHVVIKLRLWICFICLEPTLKTSNIWNWSSYLRRRLQSTCVVRIVSLNACKKSRAPPCSRVQGYRLHFWPFVRWSHTC